MKIEFQPRGIYPGPNPTMDLIAESHAGALIREGHRGLAETFQEFVRDVDRAELPDPVVLRAAIAFLRQSMLPFARWEDTQIDGCAEVAEDTAFEHAFLNAEVDALALAVADLDRAEEQSQAARRIRRCVHRIEAVLGLHVQKAEDRESPAARPVSSERALAADTGDVRDLEPAEVHHILRRNEWGVLCTVGQGSPYAVPISYGFDGRHLYVASGPGQKRRNLESHAAVCLTIMEVEDGDHWSSVVVTGEALPMSELHGKIRAFDAIRRQRTGAALSSVTDLTRIARASIFRITPGEMTGRTRG